MTVTFHAFQPAPGATAVVPRPTLFVAASTTTDFDLTTLQVTVNGDAAYGFQGFVRPAYGGRLVAPTPTYFALTLVPRRAFVYGVNVDVVVTIDGASAASRFYVSEFPPTRVPAALETARAGRPLLRQPATESYRTLLLGVFGDGPRGVAQLYGAVATSRLRSLLLDDPDAPAFRAVFARLRPEERGSLDAADVVVRQATPLWDFALNELRQLAVDAPTLDLLRTAYASLSPADRVGAVATAVALAAQKA